MILLTITPYAWLDAVILALAIIVVLFIALVIALQISCKRDKEAWQMYHDKATLDELLQTDKLAYIQYCNKMLKRMIDWSVDYGFSLSHGRVYYVYAQDCMQNKRYYPNLQGLYTHGDTVEPSHYFKTFDEVVDCIIKVLQCKLQAMQQVEACALDCNDI